MFNWFKRKKTLAENQYDAAFTAAMHPDLYGDNKIADTFDGRFDSLLLHLFPYFYDLKDSADGQALYDVMFKRLQLALREQGVGDMGIQPRMRKMMQAYTGRMTTYENAAKNNDAKTWSDALQRNLFRGVASDQTLQDFTVYAQKLIRERTHENEHNAA